MIGLATINQTGMTLFRSFWDFLQKLSFSYGDLLDIVVVALLIFFILLLLRKTRSMPIFIGFLFLGVLYTASIYFNLRLTQTIFSALFGVVLIIIAIIFQRELRRFFELVGLIGLRQRIILPVETVFKTLTRAVEYLAENRIGAIIVLPGRETIERYTDGGVTLDGRVSKSLLISIFDTSSPGHDGSVIIEGDRIRKFGVHLPLADSLDTVKKFGTRHRAALGLAEISDAFVIAVSEEKGTISVARNKKIDKLADIGTLEDRLREFYEEKFPRTGFEKYWLWLKVNYKAIFASAFLATFLWVFFTYQTSFVQRKFTVPVQFNNLNKNYIVEDFDPEKLVIVFSGRESDFKLQDLQTVKATVDLSGIDKGWHRIIIKKEYINNPTIFITTKIEPETIRVFIAELPEENL